MLVLAIDTATAQVSRRARPRRRRARRDRARPAVGATPSSSPRRSSTCAGELGVELSHLAADRGRDRPGPVHRAAGGRHHRQGDGAGAAHPGRRHRQPRSRRLSRCATRTGSSWSVLDARRREVFYAALPSRCPAACSGCRSTRSAPPGDLVAELAGLGRRGAARRRRRRCGTRTSSARSTTPSSRGASSRRRVQPRWSRWPRPASSARSSRRPGTSTRCTCARATPRSPGLGEPRRVLMAVQREVGAARREHLPMRRRHVRSVLRIEQQVYPRPWSMSLFLSELALRSTRRTSWRASGATWSATAGS